MTHHTSVFNNSCLRVPVDPISKMPKSAYERKEKIRNQQSSIDSSSTCSVGAADLDAEKLKNFYRSIPDYNDINHLPTEEFYSTLKSLRDKKKVMLGLAIEFIDDCNGHDDKILNNLTLENSRLPAMTKSCKIKGNRIPRRKLSTGSKDSNNKNDHNNHITSSALSKPRASNIITESCLKPSVRKNVAPTTMVEKKNGHEDLKIAPMKSNLEKTRTERPKRNHSACSISWNDAKFESKNEIDQKFDEFFDGKKYDSCKDFDGDDFKTQSMPSSPLRSKRCGSPTRRRKSITIPKPFKMTERDEEDRIVNELRCLRKSFSEDMLHQKMERKKFKARPVPIESRIPLYDKILEDQAMRRAITKINSEAELRAQMKPFSFTKREEKGLGGMCERAIHVLPKSKKKKRFRARPVPKNLFSNYFYDKMREDDFFRSMNKRIRADEMLRSANYPGTMAARDRSRLSTPAAHSDLPIDPSPGVPSISSSDRQRCPSPTKDRKKRNKSQKEEFITTSPQPFRFNTADRAAKKMHDVTMKIYSENKSNESTSAAGNGPGARAYSALDLRASASGRSNLAALLRAEAVRRRFEMEAASRLAEQRRRNEMRLRDRQLRSKPAWHLVKNNHEEDIAMRLQTRRDEERMRREEFLHEMELMYGRVQQQPMLFERYYAPRSLSAPLDTLQLSPRKSTKKRSSRNKSYHYNSPTRSRKVSINDTAETYTGDVTEFLNRIDIDDKYSDSEIVTDSLDRKL
ncbi:protein FAM161B [Spodoptera frugiperda]|uniref:Protein FAM161B n=1 Tax=Spodoptera frugiperda TaxID=7108 RepID=A0A9R0DDQ2_SPOFR|nr:protein FAM161B [Spodoptera frugiperda]